MKAQFLIFSIAKATTVVAFVFGAQQGLAARSAPVKEALAKAQEKFLARHRSEALKILSEALAAEGIGAKDRDELLEAQKDLATRFFGDKGQKLYEQALAQVPQQAKLAVKSLSDASETEDCNRLVELAKARALWILEDCRGAQKQLSSLPHDSILRSDTDELGLLIGICLEDLEGVEELNKKRGSDQGLSLALQKLAQAWLKGQAQEEDKARSLYREAANLDPQNLAVLYGGWKWGFAAKEGGRDQARSFLQKCRANQNLLRRRTLSMVELCYRSAEVENELKKSGTETMNEAE